MNSTPSQIIKLVVMSVAGLACMCVLTLCISLFCHVYASEQVLTSLVGTTGLLIGSLVTMLSNTRSAPPSGETTMTSSITTVAKPEPPPVQKEPQEVIVKNDPDKPEDAIPVTPLT